jgi:endonuclease-3 related protein
MKPTQSKNRKPAKPSQKSASKLREFYTTLLDRYGPQQWWPAKTQLEVIVGAFLTQNTSWKGVARSIANLESQGVLTLDSLRSVSEEELRLLIRPSGYMIRKAAAIKAFVRFLDSQYDSSLAALAAEPTATARDRLLALPGVGPETADAILLYALGHPVMVVDEYLRRVTTRHRLLHGRASYNEIQALALKAFAGDPDVSLRGHYNEFHALIVQVGKEHCGPIPRCEDCPLAGFHPRPRSSRGSEQSRRMQRTARRGGSSNAVS